MCIHYNSLTEIPYLDLCSGQLSSIRRFQARYLVSGLSCIVCNTTQLRGEPMFSSIKLNLSKQNNYSHIYTLYTSEFLQSSARSCFLNEVTMWSATLLVCVIIKISWTNLIHTSANQQTDHTLHTLSNTCIFYSNRFRLYHC